MAYSLKSNQLGGLSGSFLLPLSYMRPTASIFRSKANVDLSNIHRPILTFPNIQKPVLDRLALVAAKPTPSADLVRLSIFQLPGFPDIPVLVI